MKIRSNQSTMTWPGVYFCRRPYCEAEININNIYYNPFINRFIFILSYPNLYDDMQTMQIVICGIPVSVTA